MEEGRIVFKILTGKPTGKRPLGRPRRMWEDNIKMNHNKVGVNVRNWAVSVQNRDSKSHGVSFLSNITKKS